MDVIGRQRNKFAAEHEKAIAKVHISSYSRYLEFSSIVQSRRPAANIAVKVIHTPEVHIGTNYEYLKEKRNFEEL